MGGTLRWTGGRKETTVFSEDSILDIKTLVWTLVRDGTVEVPGYQGAVDGLGKVSRSLSSVTERNHLNTRKTVDWTGIPLFHPGPFPKGVPGSPSLLYFSPYPHTVTWSSSSTDNKHPPSVDKTRHRQDNGRPLRSLLRTRSGLEWTHNL